MTLNRRKPGMALVEMLVVITLMGVMLGLSAGLIHLLLKLDRGGRTSSELAADMTRLAADFRQDVHEASSTENDLKSLEKMSMKLSGDRTVDYLVKPIEIVRTVRHGGKVKHHDLYRRPVNASVRIEVRREASVPFATLVIDRPLDGVENSQYVDLRIEAEIGRDRRVYGRFE